MPTKGVSTVASNQANQNFLIFANKKIMNASITKMTKIWGSGIGFNALAAELLSKTTGVSTPIVAFGVNDSLAALLSDSGTLFVIIAIHR